MVPLSRRRARRRPGQTELAAQLRPFRALTGPRPWGWAVQRLASLVCGRIAASGLALAGRDAEIGALRAAWHAATGGEPGLVMIVGEAGIGKTALAELIGAEAEADGATVLRTRCYETERSLFLQPVIEAIMPVVTRTPAATLGELLGEHASAAAACYPRPRRCSARRRPGGAASRWNGGGPSRR